MNVLIDAVGIRGHGGAAVLNALLQALPEARPAWAWTVALLPRSSREFDDPVLRASVAVRTISMAESFPARLRWILRGVPRLAEEIRADVVLGFANLAAIRPSRPQVVFVQQALPLTREPLPEVDPRTHARVVLLRPAILAGARASAVVLVQTASMARSLRSAAPEITSRIRIVPSGFTVPTTSPTSPRLDAWRSGPGPRLIYVSHPAHHKNHANLLRALPHVAARIPDARLLLTFDPGGFRPDLPAALVRDLTSLVARLGVSDRVVWLGTLTPADVHDALSHATLHVFPSLAESFGLPLVESMAAGCPIAASDLPYAHDVAGDAAVYFDPLDPTSIAATILATIKAPDALDALRARGMARRERFAYPAIAEQFARAIEDAAASPSPR